MSSSALAILPISEISTYTNKWTIRARVTSKSQLRTFSKGANTGKVFSVDLLDAAGGEIRASFFNEAVDQHHDKVQVGKCYTLSKASIKVANKQYNSCNHKYELACDKSTELKEVDNDSEIETVKFNVVDLRSVQSKVCPCTTDLCGVIVNAGAALSFTSQAGKELVKREITIADDTATTMQVTLWGERAKQEDKVFEGKPVIGLKAVLVKEWQGGRAGSLLESGTMILNPTIPAAQKVQQWWSQGGGSTQNLTALSKTGGGGVARNIDTKPVSLGEMRRASEMLTDQTQHFSMVCRLARVQMSKQGETQPLYYTACQENREGTTLPCNRRVDGSGFCASCNRAGKVAPRLFLRCSFADSEDAAWLTTFHESAQEILELKAEEVQAIETGSGGREELEAIVRSKYFNQPLEVTVRAKLGSYQGEPRPDVACMAARPVSRGDRGRLMLKEISDMLASQPGLAGITGA